MSLATAATSNDPKVGSFCATNEFSIMFPADSKIGAWNPLVQRAAEVIMSTDLTAEAALGVARASMFAGQNFACMNVEDASPQSVGNAAANATGASR